MHMVLACVAAHLGVLGEGTGEEGEGERSACNDAIVFAFILVHSGCGKFLLVKRRLTSIIACQFLKRDTTTQ